MIGDLEMIVHLNLTEFSRGRLVSCDFDIRPIGPYFRISSGEVLLHTTHGLHRFSCKKLLFLMWFLHHRPQDIIQTFPGKKCPVSEKIRSSPTTEAVLLFSHKSPGSYGAAMVTMKYV